MTLRVCFINRIGFFLFVFGLLVCKDVKRKKTLRRKKIQNCHLHCGFHVKPKCIAAVFFRPVFMLATRRETGRPRLSLDTTSIFSSSPWPSHPPRNPELVFFLTVEPSFLYFGLFFFVFFFFVCLFLWIASSHGIV